MAVKLCTVCGEHPKRPGHPKWCQECWYLRQSAEEQLRHAKLRLAAVPVELRLARVPERDWPEGRRWCAGCQSFVRLRDLPKGASQCRACKSEAARAGYVQRVYDISREEELAIWEAQGRRCYICRREVKSKRPAVDHDHVTLKVRGLLCPDVERGCNHAILGNIRDLAMAERIVEYLKHPPAQEVLERMRGHY